MIEGVVYPPMNAAVYAKAGITAACKSCLLVVEEARLSPEDIGWLDENPARNAVSRRIPNLRICKFCQRAETLMALSSCSFDQARIAVYNDWQEAMRLPPGMVANPTLVVGPFSWPSGQLAEWHAELARRQMALAGIGVRIFYAFQAVEEIPQAS